MTITTDQLVARAKFWREKAVEAKWESVSIAQDMLLNADAFEELAYARYLLAAREAVTCDVERIKRHALPAGECPGQSQVVLLSSLLRLCAAPPAPAVPREIPLTSPVAAEYAAGWNACRATMLATAPEDASNE